MKRVSLSEKLKSYSLLATPFIAGIPATSGQIVYRNIFPDSTIHQNNSGFALDLNGDATTDFRIYVTDTVKKRGTLDKPFSYHGVFMNPYNGNAIAALAIPFGTHYSVYPFAFYAGDLINENVSWNTASSQILGSFLGFQSSVGATYGNWKNLFGGYMGLRLNVSGSSYYGWARLNTATSRDTVYFTIRDFAYQTIADSGIIAGDTGGVQTGIPSLIHHDLALYEYGGQIYISSSSEDRMEVRVINLEGQEVKNIITSKGKYYFSVADLPKGLYLISLEQNGIIETRKVVVR